MMLELCDVKGEAAKVQHAGALGWRDCLRVPHGVGWREHSEYEAALRAAVEELFQAEDFPAAYSADELRYERDALGKPFVTWQGIIAEWAEANGYAEHFLHVSNTHDGGAQIVLAAYHPDLAGVGIDAVYLPRLMTPDTSTKPDTSATPDVSKASETNKLEKNEAYLRRFAARFMSARERDAFDTASQNDDLNALRLRAAGHFSLMEAASKACGTGLKIGGGMGRETSLPKQSLGVLVLSRSGETGVELLFEGEALPRLEALGVKRSEAYWSADATFLISVVLLWKTETAE